MPAAPLVRIFTAPRVYIQGPGVLDQLGEAAARLGTRPAVVADAEVLERLLPRFAAALGASAPRQAFSGFVTRQTIQALADAIGEADVVVAAGGGRAIDAGKAVSIVLGARLVVAPTIASSDAATSRGAVIHDADDDFVAVDRLAFNPDVVLVDTAVIARAPARFLRWGIGDALSKVFEATACQAAGGRNAHGAAAPIAAMALAQACYDTLRRDALAALQAVDRGEPDQALENVVEAALLLSGLGFESGGLSIAHTVALALASHPATRRSAHGEQVGYGLLVQLALDPDGGGRLDDIWGFLGEVGLPRTLAELTEDGSSVPLVEALAELAANGLWVRSYPADLDKAALAAAIEGVEQIRPAGPGGPGARP